MIYFFQDCNIIIANSGRNCQPKKNVNPVNIFLLAIHFQLMKFISLFIEA